MSAAAPQPVPESRATFARAVGISALVALPGGLLLAFRQNLLNMLKDHDGKGLATLTQALCAATWEVLWDIVVVMAFLAMVGAVLWLARRSRGKAPSAAGVSAFVAAVLAMMAVHLVFRGWDTGEAERELGKYGKRIIQTEMLVVALLCAIGLGDAVLRLCRRPGRASRVFAALLGVLGALVAWSAWASCIAAQNQAVRARASGLPAAAGIVLLSAAIGAGIYQVSLAVARRGRGASRGRALLGIALLVVPVGVGGGWAVALERAGRAATAPQAAAPKDAPNILWIVMDTARADAVSCYGYPRKITPHLDAFAAEATLYERAFSVAGWTLPSHASMFTGKLPWEHRATSELEYLDDRHVTIAELLHEHGYRTFSASANDNISSRLNTVQGFEVAETHVYGRRERHSFFVSQFAKLIGRFDYGAKDSVRMATRWIARCKEAGEPFFVFLNFMEPHLKYGSTPYRARWFDNAEQLARARKVSQKYLAYAAGAARATPEEFALLRRFYDGDMTYLDERIHGLIEFLRSQGLLDDTLVIITSDHGDEQGEHGLLAHSFELYNTMLHVPLIVRYPKAFAAGARVKRVVRLTDIFPTILDLAGIEWDGRKGLNGVSLLDEQAAARRPYVVSERYLPCIYADDILARYPRWKGIPIWLRLRCIQDAQFKYVWASDGHDRLYDLRTDPGETRNVIADMPDKARELREILASFIPAIKTGRE